MEIGRRLRGGLVVLDLSGRFVVSAGESEILPFRSAIRALIDEGRAFVALNLAALTSIDARGLGELVFTRAVLRSHGGDLTLIEPSAAMRKLLLVTRLDRVFHVCDSELDVAHASPASEEGTRPSDGGHSLKRPALQVF